MLRKRKETPGVGCYELTRNLMRNAPQWTLSSSKKVTITEEEAQSRSSLPDIN